MTLALAAALIVLCAVALADGLNWAISGDGTLTISGSGTVTSSLINQIPFEDRMTVRHIVVEEGITGIESFALETFEPESVTLPASLTEVGTCILGSKGALDYTIYGEDPEALRALLAASNEEYAYFCKFEARGGDALTASPLIEIPASGVVAGILSELEDMGLRLTDSRQVSDNYGNVRYEYMAKAEDGTRVIFTSFDAETVKKITITTETLDPGDEWITLCRAIPDTQALGLSEGIRGVLAEINLHNGGRNSSAEADGWTISVGGVMDARTVWNLLKDDAYDHYTY